MNFSSVDKCSIETSFYSDHSNKSILIIPLLENENKKFDLIKTSQKSSIYSGYQGLL